MSQQTALKTAGAHNQRPGVDAGWPFLFAFSRAWPRATQAERWAVGRFNPS
jgi:hypothetical protein